jgi:hypothetical protein
MSAWDYPPKDYTGRYPNDNPIPSTADIYDAYQERNADQLSSWSTSADPEMSRRVNESLADIVLSEMHLIRTKNIKPKSLVSK